MSSNTLLSHYRHHPISTPVPSIIPPPNPEYSTQRARAPIKPPTTTPKTPFSTAAARSPGDRVCVTTTAVEVPVPVPVLVVPMLVVVVGVIVAVEIEGPLSN